MEKILGYLDSDVYKDVTSSNPNLSEDEVLSTVKAHYKKQKRQQKKDEFSQKYLEMNKRVFEKSRGTEKLNRKVAHLNKALNTGIRETKAVPD